MNAAESQRDNVGNGPNAEDIDGVLGRFQDWAKGRTEPSAAKLDAAASGPASAARKLNLTRGVRDLSYEQALRASSYRRPVYSAPAEAPQPAAIPPKEAPEADLGLSHLWTIAPEAAEPAHSCERQSKTGHSDQPIAIRAARQHAPASPKAVTIAWGWPQLDSTEFQTSADTPAFRPLVAQPDPDLPLELERSAAELAAEPGRPPFNAGGREFAHPPFRGALQEAVGLAPMARAALVPGAKPVALSVRFSDVEQARIRASAARANLSVSAYLRQCALGVDELRGQVAQALSELQKRELQSSPEPGLGAIPGIFRGFLSQCFRKLTSRDDPNSLSIR